MPAGMVRPRASQAPHASDMPPAPRGVWLVAGGDLADPYPCMCHGSRACGLRCPCRGRADVDTMPPVCCARRAAETGQRQESE
jgi:hypothetical protein